MVILTEKRLCKAYSPILNLPLSHNVAVVTSFPYEKKKLQKLFTFTFTPQWVTCHHAGNDSWSKGAMDSLKEMGIWELKNML